MTTSSTAEAAPQPSMMLEMAVHWLLTKIGDTTAAAAATNYDDRRALGGMDHHHQSQQLYNDLSYAQQVILAITPKVSAVLSVPCSVFLMHEIWCDRRRGADNAISRILFGMSVIDCLSSSAWFLSSWAVPAGSFALSAGNRASCTYQGFLLQLAIGAPLYNSSLSLFYLLVIKYRWTDEQLAALEKWVHFCILSFAVGTSVAMIPLEQYNRMGAVCWIIGEPVGCGRSSIEYNPELPCDRGDYAWILGVTSFYGPLWFCVICCCTIMLIICRIVSKTYRRSKRYSIHNQHQQRGSSSIRSYRNSHHHHHQHSGSDFSLGSRDRRRVAKQAVLYTLSFLLTWFPSTLWSVAHWGNFSHFGFDFCSALCEPLQGLWNLIIFARSRECTKQKIKTLFRGACGCLTYCCSRSAVHAESSTTTAAPHDDRDDDLVPEQQAAAVAAAVEAQGNTPAVTKTPATRLTMDHSQEFYRRMSNKLFASQLMELELSGDLVEDQGTAAEEEEEEEHQHSHHDDDDGLLPPPVEGGMQRCVSFSSVFEDEPGAPKTQPNISNNASCSIATASANDAAAAAAKQPTPNNNTSLWEMDEHSGHSDRGGGGEWLVFYDQSQGSSSQDSSNAQSSIYRLFGWRGSIPGTTTTTAQMDTATDGSASEENRIAGGRSNAPPPPLGDLMTAQGTFVPANAEPSARGGGGSGNSRRSSMDAMHETRTGTCGGKGRRRSTLTTIGTSTSSIQTTDLLGCGSNHMEHAAATPAATANSPPTLAAAASGGGGGASPDSGGRRRSTITTVSNPSARSSSSTRVNEKKRRETIPYSKQASSGGSSSNREMVVGAVTDTIDVPNASTQRKQQQLQQQHRHQHQQYQYQQNQWQDQQHQQQDKALGSAITAFFGWKNATIPDFSRKNRETTRAVAVDSSRRVALQRSSPRSASMDVTRCSPVSKKSERRRRETIPSAMPGNIVPDVRTTATSSTEK